eukprot:6489085-Amphidinium_carterae.1
MRQVELPQKQEAQHPLATGKSLEYPICSVHIKGRMNDSVCKHEQKLQTRVVFGLVWWAQPLIVQDYGVAADAWALGAPKDVCHATTVEHPRKCHHAKQSQSSKLNHLGVRGEFGVTLS